jgi:hypothetical protein
MSHKFQLRQLVGFVHTNFRDARSKIVYEVTRLLPGDQGGEVSYRIKSSTTGERAVLESEITDKSSSASLPEASAFKSPSVR